MVAPYSSARNTKNRSRIMSTAKKTSNLISIVEITLQLTFIQTFNKLILISSCQICGMSILINVYDD